MLENILNQLAPGELLAVVIEETRTSHNHNKYCTAVLFLNGGETVFFFESAIDGAERIKFEKDQMVILGNFSRSFQSGQLFANSARKVYL